MARKVEPSEATRASDGSNVPSERRGRRKDGKPYKEGNDRDDGSYVVGANRPPLEYQFRKDDGRPRGKRRRGRKSLLTEWREELDSKIPVLENGKRKSVSKRRALIKSKIKRGIEKSDRAAETSLRYDELSERRAPELQADDREIIEKWLVRMLGERDSDDADLNPPPRGEANAADDKSVNRENPDA